MTRHSISSLHKSIEDRIVGILKVKGYIIARSPKLRDSPSMVSYKLTDKGKRAIEDLVQISEEDLEAFREIFPRALRGTPAVIAKKLQRYQIEHPDVTMEDIFRATRAWVKMKGDFCGTASNFIYKKEKDGEISRLTEALEFISKDQSDPFNRIVS